LAPKTPAGKILTIVYAVFGVPLMLLCLSNLGQLLANAFQFAYSHMCCSRRRPKRTHRHRQLRATPSAAATAAPASPELVAIPPPEQFKRMPPPPPPRLTPLKPRVLPPEARQLLLECAEYSVSQGAEPQALLTDLRRTPKEPSAEELLCAQRLNRSVSAFFSNIIKKLAKKYSYFFFFN
jgi:Ion channel